MIKTIQFKDKIYPYFTAEGNAAQYAIPFAKQVCKGYGYDIGYNREDWKFPGAKGIDPINGEGYDATTLPEDKVDYIFSSHCLEHLDDWVGVLDYWKTKLKKDGVLFLYLPHYNQEYWRPWNNRKHRTAFVPSLLKDYLVDRGYINVFVSECDLNYAFMAMGQVSK